jgi:hypothetical protein
MNKKSALAYTILSLCFSMPFFQARAGECSKTEILNMINAGYLSRPV